MKNLIIKVDYNDNEIGYGEKIDIHRKGELHRAFSIFIFNDTKVLLQRRQFNKYHSSGLWTNTCCSHPKVGEELLDSAKKRLNEEMGFSCDLKEVFSFKYKTEFADGLIENEIDHVFIGCYDGKVSINLEEVCEYKWVEYDQLKVDVETNKEIYTYWFKYIIRHYDLKKYISCC